MSGVDGAEQQKKPEPADGPPPRKVMRRIGHTHSVSDMGVLGAVQHLKSEARQLKAIGYSALFRAEAPALQANLSSYLSGSAARVYDDPHGCEHQIKASVWSCLSPPPPSPNLSQWNLQET